MIITSTAVLNFVGQLSPEFRYRLLNQMDPGRHISLMQFKDFLNSKPRPIKKIAVVSGSLSEAELFLFEGTTEVTLLNFDDFPDLFDLNKDWSLRDYS